MLYAKKGNRQFKINKEDQAQWVKDGYTVLEVEGKKKKIISKPANVKDLAKENKSLKAKITKLEKQIEALQPKETK